MPEKFPYNLEKAQKEAIKMQTLIKDGKAKDYTEAEKMSEDKINENKEPTLTKEQETLKEEIIHVLGIGGSYYINKARELMENIAFTDTLKMEMIREGAMRCLSKGKIKNAEEIMDAFSIPKEDIYQVAKMGLASFLSLYNSKNRGSTMKISSIEIALQIKDEFFLSEEDARKVALAEMANWISDGWSKGCMDVVFDIKEKFALSEKMVHKASKDGLVKFLSKDGLDKEGIRKYFFEIANNFPLSTEDKNQIIKEAMAKCLSDGKVERNYKKIEWALEIKSALSVPQKLFDQAAIDGLAGAKNNSIFFAVRNEHLSKFSDEELIKLLIEKSTKIQSMLSKIKEIYPDLYYTIFTNINAFVFMRGWAGKQEEFFEFITGGIQASKNISEKLDELKINSESANEELLSKIKDINSDGVAFSVVNAYGGKNIDNLPERFKKILSEGLLGTSYKHEGFTFGDEKSGGNSDNVSKELWTKNTKKDKNTLVHFNITGRMVKHGYEKIDMARPIATSFYVGSKYAPKDAVIILFNLESFKEDDPTTNMGEKIKTKTYKANRSEFKTGLGDIDTPMFDKQGRVESQYGFILSHRIAPRFFKGITLKLHDEMNNAPITDHKMFLSFAEQYILSMIENSGGNINKLFPIYDVDGNMHWPVYMTNEDIKDNLVSRI